MSSPNPYREPGEPARASRLKNPGGTPGGAAEFLIGLALLIVGGYLFMDNIVVTGGHGGWFGFRGSSGLLLIPIFIGIAMLFFNGKSFFGWVLAVGGVIAILAGVIARMNIYFKPASLVETLIMIGLMAAGVGLVAKGIRAH